VLVLSGTFHSRASDEVGHFELRLVHPRPPGLAPGPAPGAPREAAAEAQSGGVAERAWYDLLRHGQGGGDAARRRSLGSLLGTAGFRAVLSALVLGCACALAALAALLLALACAYTAPHDRAGQGGAQPEPQAQ